jgi:molecular chaperone DnaK (HSP70)
VVLPANTPIPTAQPAEQTFGTVQEGQHKIDVTVNEGEETELRFVKRLASGCGDLGGPKPRGYPIVVKMALDGDGILRVTAHDGMSGALLTQIEIQHEDGMSAQQRALAATSLDDMVVI